MRLEFGSDFVRSESRSGGVAEQTCDEGAQPALMFVGRTRLRGRGANERSDTAPGFENAGPLEVRVDPGDGVGIDAEIDGELTNGGKLVAFVQPAGGDCRPQTTVELGVNRRRIPRVNSDNRH